MTFEERRMIKQMQQNIEMLSVRVSTQAAILDRLVRRKAGRPTKEEAAELTHLADRMHEHGATV